MKFTYYIGVDVSKNKLDIAVFKGSLFVYHKVIANNKIEINRFIKSLKELEGFSLSEAVFCMEHTGIYNNPLLVCLHKKKGNICLEAASQIKSSLGNIRGKNDKIDSIRIGEYVYKNREEIKLWAPKRGIIVKLEKLTVLRDRLIGAKKQLSVPLKEQEGFVNKALNNLEKKICQRTLNSLQADLGKVDKQIEKTIKEDRHLSHLFEIITSVQSVGTQTAVQIIIRTNEFKDINDPKKFACYSGVAPFTKESGLFKGRGRVSHMANKKVKTLLHMCAIVAIGYNSDLKAYYLRKTTEGKNKMSVINAVRNKLIHRVFTCVNENRKYENIYIKALV
jgi:transposase